MRHFFILLSLYFVWFCSDDPLSSKKEWGYKIVFLSDRDYDGMLHIELGTQSEVYVMNIDGSEQIRMTQNETWDASPQYSPDGTKIVYSAASDWLMSDIQVMSSAGIHIINLGPGKAPIFSNDNSKILYQKSGLIGLINVDGSNPRTLTCWPDSIYSTFGQDFPKDLSSDDQTILFHSIKGNTYQIYTMNVDGSGLNQITTSPGRKYACSFSADDNKILYVSYENNTGQIYIIGRDGINPIQLTDTEGHNYQPSLSPDGNKIAFISSRDGQSEVYIMNIDGTEQVRLTNNEYNKSDPVFSPDGKYIVFEQNNESGPYNNGIDIYSLEMLDGKIKNLTNTAGYNYSPSFGPMPD